VDALSNGYERIYASIICALIFAGVLSALKNLQDRLKQVECEKQEAEQNLNKLAASATSAQAAGKSLFNVLTLTSIHCFTGCNFVKDNF